MILEIKETKELIPIIALTAWIQFPGYILKREVQIKFRRLAECRKQRFTEIEVAVPDTIEDGNAQTDQHIFRE